MSCSTCAAPFADSQKPSLVIRGKPFCAACADAARESYRKHILDEERKVLVATTDTLTGYRICDYRGTVYGTAMSVLGAYRELGADFADFVGLSEGYEATIQALHQRAERRLRLLAADRGANAVVGVRFDVELMESTDGKSLLKTRDRKILVAASGTAVMVETTS